MKKRLTLFCLILFANNIFCDEIEGLGKCAKTEKLTLEECRDIAFDNAKNDILKKYNYYSISKEKSDSLFNKYLTYKNFEYSYPALFGRYGLIVICEIKLDIDESFFKYLLNSTNPINNSPLKNISKFERDSLDIEKITEKKKTGFFLDIGFGGTLYKISNFDNNNSSNFAFSPIINLNIGTIKSINKDNDVAVSIGLFIPSLNRTYKNQTEDISVSTNAYVNGKIYWIHKEFCFGLEGSYSSYSFSASNPHVSSSSENDNDFFSLYLGKYFFERSLILDASIPFLLETSTREHNSFFHNVELKPLFYMSVKYIF